MKKEKIYNFLLFILIFLSTLSIILLKPLNNLDEIWNYNFARNVADGLVPYKDFSMLQMPLLPIICGIILKIFTNQLIIMRILAALLDSAIIYTSYKLFNILNIKKEVCILFTFIIGSLLYDLLCIDYNYATLLFVLIIIYYEIKWYQQDAKLVSYHFKRDFILGLLAGLTITLKQTTGIFICIALLGNKLVFVKSKEELKIYLKSFIYRVLGILLPLLCMLLYLLWNGALPDFISYTMKGVSGFSNYKSYANIIKWDLLGVLSILVPITFIYAWIKSIILEKDKAIYLLLVYGLAMFVVCFPISDKIHFMIGALPTLILILYELYNLIKKILWTWAVNFMMCATVLFLAYFSILNLYHYFNNIDNTSVLNHYSAIPISKNFDDEIKVVDEFILNNSDVKILDASAAIYMIPINRYNKNYDMFLKGNLGENGENKLIDEIANSNDTKYLILKNKYSKNWQIPLDVINYVMLNKIKTGEIGIFDIYE